MNIIGQLRRIPVVKLLSMITALLVAISLPQQMRAQEPTELADTPWPMRQHDPNHTGRSPYLGIVNEPVLLWKQRLPHCTGESGGISIGDNGRLYISDGGCLRAFDPQTREILWTLPYGDNSRAVPTIRVDGNLYWGFGDTVVSVLPNKSIDWMVSGLTGNYIFGSSPAIDGEGNIYFSHDGMWSFTSDGEFRWAYLYGQFAHSSPAIGLDGTIYGAGNYGLYAFNPDGSIKMFIKTSRGTTDNSPPAIGADGTIYVPIENAILQAYNPDGSFEWEFRTDESTSPLVYSLNPGIAIGSSGTLYFSVIAWLDTVNVYAVNPDGSLKWKFPMKKKQSGDYGGVPAVPAPITVDAQENIYVCAQNDTCYGISPDGKLLWEYYYPPAGSVPVWVVTSPIIASEGMMYFLDSQEYVNAFGDPAVIPIMTSDPPSISVQADDDTPMITATFQITSTLSPISYTAIVSPSDWIILSQSSNATPSQIDIQIKTEGLKSGVHTATLSLIPDILSNWLEIPISLDFDRNLIYFPFQIR